MTRTELEDDAIIAELETQVSETRASDTEWCRRYFTKSWEPDAGSPEPEPIHVARYNYSKRKYRGE